MTANSLVENLKLHKALQVTGIVFNNTVAQQAIAILGQEKQNFPAPLYVIEDQVVPANSPEVSEAQQQMAAFAQVQDCPYIYGQAMASRYLLEQGTKAGEVYISGDADIAMVGAVGALGVAVSAEQLAQVAKSGFLELPDCRLLPVELTGKLAETADLRDVAKYLVEELEGKVDRNTVLVFTEDNLSLEDKMFLCGWTQKLGVLSALFACDEECATLAKGEGTLVSFSLPCQGVRHLGSIDEQPVTAVFIGGAYGGSLEAIKAVAEALQGKKVAYKVRLSVAPASAAIYVAAANAGYLTTILQAEGLVLNQCAAPPVQARIGKGEVMVTNDIHDEQDYAGEGGIIYAVSTQEAIAAALTGKIGGEQ